MAWGEKREFLKILGRPHENSLPFANVGFEGLNGNPDPNIPDKASVLQSATVDSRGETTLRVQPGKDI